MLVIRKVASVQPSEKVHVKSRGVKQGLYFGRLHRRSRGVAWEKDVGVLKVDFTYKIRNVTVQAFNGAKYLIIIVRELHLTVGRW